jgi:hypothetical protein
MDCGSADMQLQSNILLKSCGLLTKITIVAGLKLQTAGQNCDCGHADMQF